MKHILIDFENVNPPPEDLARLEAENCHIWLFLGKLQQKALPLELCESLCLFGKNVHFVRVSRVSKNALDFYLAYYLGRISLQDEEAEFCILSGDSGYDTLIDHLESRRHCRQIVRLGSLNGTGGRDGDGPAGEEGRQPMGIIESPAFISACIRKTIEYLRRPDSFRPRSHENLISRLINFVLENDLYYLDEGQRYEAAALVVHRLMSRRLISTERETGLLAYHCGDEDILAGLVGHLQEYRPKNARAAANLLQTRAQSWGLALDDGIMQNIFAYCEQRQILRLRGDDIEYPPFAPVCGQQAEVLPAVREEAAVQPAPDQEGLSAVADKVLAFFFKKYIKDKPQSRSALKNILLSTLDLDEGEAEALIGALAAQNKLQIADNGRVIYPKG
ncbi:MAG: PIN domain-containing protein [Neisseria sp.]|nr:PIN domain-containing protein [Neisseria sp.]